MTSASARVARWFSKFPIPHAVVRNQWVTFGWMPYFGANDPCSAAIVQPRIRRSFSPLPRPCKNEVWPVETRTPDFYRVKVTTLSFITTYKTAGTAKVRGSRARHIKLWVELWVEIITDAAPNLLHLFTTKSPTRPEFSGRAGLLSINASISSSPVQQSPEEGS